MSTLQLTWFLIVSALLTIYLILDGADLGVGIWQVLCKKGADRNANVRSIGPYWDMNEVWLLTGGASLFAAFPPVYAAFASGFYLAVMLLIWALILRAVSMEYRAKIASVRWQSACDWGITLGSAIPALLLGVAFGNILRGIPLNEAGDYTGTFFALLNPFALAVGLGGVLALVVHGGLFQAAKTAGKMQEQAARRAAYFLPPYALAALLILAWALWAYPHLRANYARHFWTWLAPIVFIMSVGAVFLFLRKKAFGGAFVASAISLASFMACGAIGLFPNLIPASNIAEWSLSIWTASSSEKTLGVMFIIAGIGLPVVVLYTAFMYYLVEKKLGVDEDAY